MKYPNRNELRKETRDKSLYLLNKSTETVISKYLINKKIENNFGAKTIDNGNILYVPIFDREGLHSIQIITAESKKLFLKNTNKKSSFYLLKSKEDDFLTKIKNTKIIMISEGFATACSLQMAFPNQLVVCAFDCGNILPVVEALLQLNSTLYFTLCGDRDFKSKAGEKAITEVNKKYPHQTIPMLPKFGMDDNHLSDYNDLHCRYGLQRVRDQVSLHLFKFNIYIN